MQNRVCITPGDVTDGLVTSKHCHQNICCRKSADTCHSNSWKSQGLLKKKKETVLLAQPTKQWLVVVKAEKGCKGYRMGAAALANM